MIFLFPENMILFFRQKMMTFLKKNAWKYDIFFKCYKKVVLPKKIILEYDLSCTIRKDSISFSQKHDIFLRRKMKDDLSQKKFMEIWQIFPAPLKKMTLILEKMVLAF